MVLLFLLFLPARDPVTHSLTVEWRPSAELAFLLFLAAIIGVARPQIVEARPAARLLAILVGLAALLNLVHAATPTLLGRDLSSGSPVGQPVSGRWRERSPSSSARWSY